MPFEVAGIAAGNVTYGHRFMAGGKPIRVRRFDDYVPALEAAKVVLDAERRMAIIETEAKNLAFAQGLELVEDRRPARGGGRAGRMAGRADGIVRRGVPRHSRRGDPPHHPAEPEMLRAARSEERPGSPPHDGGGTGGALTNRFILICQSRGARRRQGDRRRQRAGHRRAALRRALLLGAGPKATRSRTGRRSSTASPSTRSSAARPSGSSASRGWRASWRRSSAPIPTTPERAARLAKADLTTGMVGEFPELQGVMGRYYALAAGREARSRRRHPRPLQAAGAERFRAERAGVDRGRARRQARHAGRLLGDRREADGEQGPVRAETGGAGGDPDRAASIGVRVSLS